MSIKKTLLMLTLNYIVIFAWMFWHRMGEISALIIFPITMGIAFLDTIFAEGRKSAYLWCGNLLIATVVGIFLQAYLYIRVTGDFQTGILRVMIEIPVAVLIIGIVALVSGHEAAKIRKRKLNSISGNAGHEEALGRRSFFAGIDRNAVRKTMDLSDEEEGYGDEDDFDDPEDKDDGPLLRVIKKS